jgi:ubiquinone/menaquinone biosynthesis C-methylase UbiE
MSAHEHWQMDASAPELYERYLVPAITSVWATDLLDRVGPRRGESVLDIACGTGVVARLAEQRGHDGRLVGIDLNTAMLAVARAKSATVDWVEGSALDLPFDANSFDVVLCQLGLQFFPDRPLALREMVRVLKSGGRAGLSVYSAIERMPAAHAFVQALDKYLGQIPHEPSVPSIFPAMRRRSARGQSRPASTLSMWPPSPNKSPSRRCWTMSAFSSRRRRWLHS